jgi:hypothetical protein
MVCQAETTTFNAIECYIEPLDASSLVRDGDDEWNDFFSSVDENKTSSNLSVSFNEYITVVECLHRNEYTKKEFKATWYSSKEMEKNQESNKKVVLQMSSGKNLNTKEMCTRGLETRTPIGNKKRQRNKAVGWNAVEQEQLYQWENGFADAEPVADVYIAATQDCVQAAVNLGNEDRKAVLEQEKDDLANSSSDKPVATVAGLFKKHSRHIRSSLVSVHPFGPLSRAE